MFNPTTFNALKKQTSEPSPETVEDELDEEESTPLLKQTNNKSRTIYSNFNSIKPINKPQSKLPMAKLARRQLSSS